jgi:hypothetical protein
MGMYQYTRRTETKTIAGVKIGRFAYAYKLSAYDGWQPASRRSNRTVRLLESHADRAYNKTKNVEFFIVADSFDVAEYPTGVPVFQITGDVIQFTECASDVGKLIGTLKKVGRKFYLSTLTEEVQCA